MITVEYLLPFNTNKGICRNIKSFNSLLESNSDISISDSKLSYKKSKYNYQVSMDIVENQDCNVFHVRFDISKITPKFREMLRSFKNTVGHLLKDDLQIIWDGIGFEWSKELYPKIYRVENLMRKLISKFMLINLGIGWHDSAVPKEVKDSIKTPTIKPSHGILYEVDFIQLSHFLFKKYAFKDVNKLPEIIEKVLNEGLDDTDSVREKIEDYIPKNNWDRYISGVVDCESEQLQKKWNKLYEIRCKVAHNKSLNLEDYEDGKVLSEYLESILQNAFDSLNSVQIPEEEKESISLNTIATIHEPTKSFIDNYNLFSTGLTEVLKNNQGIFSEFNESMSPINAVLESSKSGLVNVSDYLTQSLGNIEMTKNSVLSSYSLENLNRVTDNYMNSFTKANMALRDGIEGIDLPADNSIYIDPNTNFFNKSEDNE